MEVFVAPAYSRGLDDYIYCVITVSDMRRVGMIRAHRGRLYGYGRSHELENNLPRVVADGTCDLSVEAVLGMMGYWLARRAA